MFAYILLRKWLSHMWGRGDQFWVLGRKGVVLTLEGVAGDFGPWVRVFEALLGAT